MNKYSDDNNIIFINTLLLNCVSEFDILKIIHTYFIYIYLVIILYFS